MITAQNSQLEFNVTQTASGEFVSGILDSAVSFCLGDGFIVVGAQASDGSETQYFVSDCIRLFRVFWFIVCFTVGWILAVYQCCSCKLRSWRC